MTYCRCPRCKAERREAVEKVITCLLVPTLGAALYTLWRVMR